MLSAGPSPFLGFLHENLCFLPSSRAQFPIEKFLSYGRIFTLHYYFLMLVLREHDL